MQMLNRLRCPPLIPLVIRPPMRVSMASPSPISLITRSACARFSDTGIVSRSCSCAE
uniref:Uncharacterized protein n=1 Tax=Arundo donax TaxID=35708 RepID=A0A0A8ZVW1_ARUDO